MYIYEAIAIFEGGCINFALLKTCGKRAERDIDALYANRDSHADDKLLRGIILWSDAVLPRKRDFGMTRCNVFPFLLGSSSDIQVRPSRRSSLQLHVGRYAF